jgi:hypothetical protein
MMLFGCKAELLLVGQVCLQRLGIQQQERIVASCHALDS